MPPVIVREASYDYAALRPLISDILDSLIGGKISQGSRVVVKPNLLAPATPDRAMLTHPLIVRTVVEHVLEAGGRVQVSDSPAIGSFEKVLKESGIRASLEGLPVEFREFKEFVAVDAGEPFRKIEIARDALEADLLINLPKLKTHAHMLLTLGVKNLFGTIVGMRKPEWHLRTGVDREMFARLLVRICRAVNPAVTILDGVLAMEGQGPGKGGEPREVGVVMASTDPFSLDLAATRMVGVPLRDVPTNRIALEEGIVLEEIELDGELPEVKGYRLPDQSPLIFGPRQLHGFMRRHLIQRPECQDDLCRLCGECWRYCPAKAITKDKRLRFDYEKCIRCYCCVEVCPYGALKARETVTGKLARKVLRIE